MNLVDYPISYFNSLKIRMVGFLRYKKVYKNYFQVIGKVLHNDYPFNAILRSGEIVKITDPFYNKLISNGLFPFIQIKNEILEIKKINLFDGLLFSGHQYGDILAVFFEKDYEFLNARNKIVIDIGANIGDTAIYFILMGAKKVIGLEPSQEIFRHAEKNLKLNNMSSKVNLFLAGCSTSKTGIESNYAELILENIPKSNSIPNDNKKIQTLSLEDLIKDYSNEKLILKIDCEGCEYDNILNTSDHILKKFDQIQIEYHYGYADLKKKLQKCGFKVSISKPTGNAYFYPLSALKIHVGYLYAEKHEIILNEN